MLLKHGVGHVVVCPGSRNAPLVHNFNECPLITCHPVTDERSAGFVALGLTQQLSAPVAVCVTSGSALLNVLPAVAEATYQQSGIVVISADRPQQWIDQLDGQTLPQPDALGRFVGKSVNLPEPHDEDERWYCERLINEVFLALSSPSHPSVHINVPITEPLFDFTVEILPEVRETKRTVWEESKEKILDMLNDFSRPMMVVGQLDYNERVTFLLDKLGERMPVLSEQLSTGHQTFTDQLLYSIHKQQEPYRPDCVIYIGGHTVSKRLRQFLRTLTDAYQIMVNADGTLHDVSQNTRLIVQGGTVSVLEGLEAATCRMGIDGSYVELWKSLKTGVKAKHDTYDPEYSQMLAVKLFEKSINCSSVVYYANSMSVRLAAIYADHYCYCNRGVNGIEGSLSVAVGASLAQATLHPDALTYCVIGDLSFFYDENALWQQQLGGNLRILLLNNSQGGIFRNLRGLEKSAARDSLVSAHHETSAEGVCEQFGIHYLRATDEKALRVGLELLHSLKSHRPVLLEVMSDVNEDERVFKGYFENLKTHNI